MDWRISTRCVEDQGCIAAGTWRKSTHSSQPCNTCVGAGTGPGVVSVKDTTLGDASPVLEFTPVAWRALTLRLKAV